VMSIEVLWRSGKDSLITNVAANRVYEIDEAGAVMPTSKPKTIVPSPLFEDVSALIAHEHYDEPFDDFQRQSLLPKKLSQLGPGVAWGDLAGDGLDDLLIGSGKGGHLAGYRNNGKGGFTRLAGKNFDQVVSRDQTAVLLSRGANQKVRILTGSANYEDGLKTDGGVLSFAGLWDR